MNQLTKAQAIAFGEAELWKAMSLQERAIFQMEQDMLCMPFGVFHEAVEKTLRRPVYTHEFALNRDGIRGELLNGDPAPTLQEVMALLPKSKRLIVFTRKKS